MVILDFLNSKTINFQMVLYEHYIVFFNELHVFILNFVTLSWLRVDDNNNDDRLTTFRNTFFWFPKDTKRENQSKIRRRRSGLL